MLSPSMTIWGKVIIPVSSASLLRPSGSRARLISSYSIERLASRVFALEQYGQKDADPGHNLTLSIDLDLQQEAARWLSGEVALNDVSFSYAEPGTASPAAASASGPALRGIDVTVPAGHSLAIVGETGSGKTTLSYLIPRLYDVTSGSVTIDGTDVRDLAFGTLTDAVGVVSQETYLFHASVAENLRFAKPSATDDELVAAAKVAQIHDHLMSLPDGYDTIVGERGYRFSGGEKQRLAIARAVLRDPPVLVLDEATSALDTQTEQAVQEAIDAVSAGRTTITIAHRLSTIRDADEIIVLDHGAIAERGTHAELLALGGHYAALVSRDADLAEAAA